MDTGSQNSEFSEKVKALLLEQPLLQKVAEGISVFWKNPYYRPGVHTDQDNSLSMADILEAEARLSRFAPFVEKKFPETQELGGLIESPLIKIPAMQEAMAKLWQSPFAGELMVKLDSHLPISGSIKARGGIYEVFAVAERLALENGLITLKDNYSVLATDKCRDFFSQYSLAVGSTGNLGLSIGISGASLGFKVTVHMSADAKTWKKDMLRELGVRVLEYESDYSIAVAMGRKEAEKDPKCHFVDDEASVDLFMGYSVAALRLKKQLEELNVPVDEEHPLLVYLPCGVGGGPGGVAFGLKHVFGDAVHCIFAEPTASPAVLLGLATGLGAEISVNEFGLTNKTAADGLAVGRPSGLVCSLMREMLEGVGTSTDETLFTLLRLIYDSERIKLEPSALAGFAVIAQSMESLKIAAHPNVTHLVWATGGSLVPDDQWQIFYSTRR